MATRNREFNDARAKNLTKSSANLSSYSNYNASSRIQNQVSNQSFTSSFAKKPKPDVCVTCVNKKIATEKRMKEINDKYQEIEEYKAQLQQRNRQRDLAKECREKMLKETSQYNRKMISSHQQLAGSQKLQDSRYMSELMQKQIRREQQQKQRMEKEKALTLQYRKDLYLQLKKEEEKKKEEKLSKLKPQNNQLDLKYIDRSKMIKDYAEELKKQISTNTQRKYAEKDKQVQQEKQILSISQRDFLKYSQFVKDDQKSQAINPEVFEQLKLIDYTKKIKKLEERQMKNREREAELMKERQLIKSETQRSLRMKADYERELKQQMTQRSLRTAAERQQELKFPWKIEKYTQDIIKQSRIVKPCDECSHEYDQRCLV